MSDSHYSYDESTEVWPFFALTIVGAIVVPVTLTRALTARPKALRKKDHPPAYNADAQEEFSRVKNQKSRWTLSTVLLLIGWAFIFFFIYIIYNVQSNAEPQARFDPYELLGISESATVKEIKSIYRKLSLQFHPDKFKETLEMTKEMAESKFIDLTKAYKSLTDEVTRENFLRYGHPDGPQQSKHGIALPSFLVGGGSPVLMLCYAILIGGILPYAVGTWWAKQKVRTRAGILFETSSIFFELIAKEQAVFISNEVILHNLASAPEMRQAVPGNKSAKEIRALLDAHLERKPVPNEQDKLAVVTEALVLLEGLFNIAAEFKSAPFLQRVIHIHRCIVQAVPLRLARAGERLQIPGSDLKTCSVSESNFDVFSKLIPKLHVLRAQFKIPGDVLVTPRSQPYFEIKYVIGPLNEPCPKVDVDELDLLAENDYEDVRELTNPEYLNSVPPPLPPALTPFQPEDIIPNWVVMLTNERDSKVVHAPVKISNVDLSNLELTAEQRKTGDGVVIGTYKIQLSLPAPQFPGMFAFRLFVSNRAYFGVDSSVRCVMTVSPETALPTPEPEEEDFEEEQDEEEEEEEGPSDIDTDTEDEDEEETKK